MRLGARASPPHEKHFRCTPVLAQPPPAILRSFTRNPTDEGHTHGARLPPVPSLCFFRRASFRPDLGCRPASGCRRSYVSSKRSFAASSRSYHTACDMIRTAPASSAAQSGKIGLQPVVASTLYNSCNYTTAAPTPSSSRWRAGGCS